MKCEHFTEACLECEEFWKAINVAFGDLFGRQSRLWYIHTVCEFIHLFWSALHIEINWFFLSIFFLVFTINNDSFATNFVLIKLFRLLVQIDIK